MTTVAGITDNVSILVGTHISIMRIFSKKSIRIMRIILIIIDTNKE
jgi:hypothetical protein